MSREDAPSRGPGHVRWLFSTLSSRLLAAWLVVFAFLYLTSWSVWTFIALLDVAQILGRSQQRAQRLLAWLTRSIARRNSRGGTHTPNQTP